MRLVERGDLEADPVVRFQHRHYVPIALFSGLILPALIAKYGWNDGMGGLVWGGAIARLLIWHTTFCINSLAHWTGLQPYTEEVTARGNYVSRRRD
jgi:stearoyl-CoA desaturase (delta-9 desaturase)